MYDLKPCDIFYSVVFRIKGSGSGARREWTSVSICMLPTYKQRCICVSRHTTGSGSPLSRRLWKEGGGGERGGDKAGMVNSL